MEKEAVPLSQILTAVKAEPGQQRPEDNNRIRIRRLFQKDLSASDVGKMNRVVIPKKCAVKYFPRIFEGRGAVRGDGNEVRFYDRELKMWTFRYSYWSSSGSYVFTRDWSKFVKAKGLAANDTVVFSVCERFEDNPDPFFLIDVIKNRTDDGGLGVVGFDQNVEDDQIRQVLQRKSFKLFGVHIFVEN